MTSIAGGAAGVIATHFVRVSVIRTREIEAEIRLLALEVAAVDDNKPALRLAKADKLRDILTIKEFEPYGPQLLSLAARLEGAAELWKTDEERARKEARAAVAEARREDAVGDLLERALPRRGERPKLPPSS